MVVGKGVPRNLLDNVPHERSALAEVALGARNTGLRLARGDLLYTRKPGQPVSLFSMSRILHLASLSSSSIRVRRYISGWTYVTLVKADGNAGLLLDFLGHRGGRRWSMSSMEVRSSNRTFAIFTTKARQQARGPWCGAILGGLGDCCLRRQIMDFTCTNPRICD